MQKFLAIYVILIVLVLTIIGCDKPAPAPKLTPASAPVSTPTPAAVAPKPQYGGILRMISINSPLTIGYPPELTVDYIWTQPWMEGLLRKDMMGRPLPWLATSWEIPSDGKSLTLGLRKGVKFHDGTDFNSQAVKYNLEITKAARPELKLMNSIDIIDEYTLKLNLSTWNNALLEMLMQTSGCMVSPTAIAKNGKEWARANEVATGPFKVKSFQRDVSLKLERFEDYWDKGKPYLDGFEYVFIVDPNTAEIFLLKGEAQAMHFTGVPPRVASEIKEKGYEVFHTPAGGDFLTFDSVHSDSPFADKRVRQAVEYAIDKASLAKALGYGFSQAAYQMCYPGTMGYNSDLEGRIYNPEKARQLLKEAGYEKGFKTTLNAQNTINQDALVALKRFLNEVGIDANLNRVEYAAYTNYIWEGWNGLLYGVGGAGSTYGLSTLFPASQYPSRTRWHTLLRPAAWGDILKQALAATDSETQIALTKKLVRMMQDEAMTVPLWVTERVFIADKSVHDAGFFTTGASEHWFPANTWLSK